MQSENDSFTVFSKLKKRLQTTLVYDFTYSTATKAIVNVAVSCINAEKLLISILKKIYDINLCCILTCK